MSCSHLVSFSVISPFHAPYPSSPATGLHERRYDLPSTRDGAGEPRDEDSHGHGSQLRFRGVPHAGGKWSFFFFCLERVKFGCLLFLFGSGGACNRNFLSMTDFMGVCCINAPYIQRLNSRSQSTVPTNLPK